MKENKGMWAAVAALLPPLIIAATGWFEAHREVEAEASQKFAALDNYADYIKDRMERDAALERALQHCMALLPAVGHSAPAAEEEADELEGALAPVFEGTGGTYAMGPPPEVSVDLDAVAEEFGYEQKQVKP